MERIYLMVGHVIGGVGIGYVGMSVLWFFVKQITDRIVSIYITNYTIVDYIINRKKYKEWKKLNK